MQTIYAFIKNNKEYERLLPNYKMKRFKNNHCFKSKQANLPSIKERGDSDKITSWEADLVKYGRNTTENVTTLFNRPSKYVRFIKNEDGRAETVLGNIYIYSDGIKILTMDRGIEFLRPQEIRRHGIEPYYCDAMSPWQKGGCENSNRILRRWLPRGTNITEVAQKDLDEIADKMNNTPRKSIGYMTPNEFYANPPIWCTSS
jgi:IS30 family transposase